MSDVNLESIFEHREKIRKPRWRKVLPWVTGAVLIAGVLVFVGVKWGNTGHTTATPLHGKALDVSKVPKTIKLAPGAEKTARDFIRTAVARKDLRRAYELAGTHGPPACVTTFPPPSRLDGRPRRHPGDARRRRDRHREHGQVARDPAHPRPGVGLARAEAPPPGPAVASAAARNDLAVRPNG